jgi:hypothetical protein
MSNCFIRHYTLNATLSSSNIRIRLFRVPIIVQPTVPTPFATLSRWNNRYTKFHAKISFT